MKRPSISDALRIARKRYADGGAPWSNVYGDLADNKILEQLQKDISKQKAGAIPVDLPLRYPSSGATPSTTTPDTAAIQPSATPHTLGGYDAVPPVVGGGGGYDAGFAGLPSAASSASTAMSSTSAGPSAQAGASPGFSFSGAPIGAVEASDLPAPAPAAPAPSAPNADAVFAANDPLSSLDQTGLTAAPNNSTANQAALGAQVGTQVGNALNTIGATPAAAIAPTATPSSSQALASAMAAQQAQYAANQAQFDTMGNVTSPAVAAQSNALPSATPAQQGTTPGVQQPSFVSAPLATAAQLQDNPDITGPTMAGLAYSQAAQDQTISGETGAFNAAAPATSSTTAAISDAPSAPSAPAAPSAPSAPTAAPSPSANPLGISIQETDPSDPALANALADAQAQAAAEAAAAVDSTATADNSSMSGMDDGGWGGTGDGSDGSSMGGTGGEGDGGFGGEGGGSSGGDSSGGSGGDGGGGGGGDGGGGGGGEKRGGYIQQKHHNRHMVDKALKVVERKKGDKVSAYPLKPDNEGRKHAGYSETGGKMKWMAPSKFLEQSEKMQMDKGDKKSIKKFRKKMEKGRKLNPLALYPSGGQDGRHRATAAEKLGIKKVPVITWPGKAEGGSIVDRALMVASKSANRQRGRP